jgi:pilus assembly protein CpaE
MTEVILSGVGEAQVKRIRGALHSLPPGAITLENDASAEGFVEALAGERPSVVAFGPELDGKDRFALTRALVEIDPTIGILIVETPTEEVVLKALEAGARGVLSPTSTAAETRATFERVLAVSRRLHDRQESVEPESARRRTIVVISAKGGAGKTVVAVNLAAAIALGDRRQAAIMDLDLQFGDVATALLLTPEHTILDAADTSTAGATALKVFLARHPPTDLFALCAPEDPGAGEQVSSAMVGEIIDALAKEFRYQVVDTSAGLEEHTLVALERATDVVIVVDLDVPSVRGARKLLEALDVIGLSQAKRYLVLNRADSKVGLKFDEVVAALNAPIDVTLPSSRAVPLSYNEGRPLVISHPRHPFSRGIRSLAERIVQPPRGSRRSP